MRKFLAIMLTFAMLLSLSACGTSPDPDSEKEKTEQTEGEASSEKEEKEEEKETAPEEQEESAEENLDSAEKIDLAALDALETADTFAVKVTASNCVPGLFDDGSPVVSLNGEDGIQITLENKSTSKIDQFSLLLLCTNEKGEAVGLGGLSRFNPPSVIAGKVAAFSDEVKVMGTDTADLAAGTSKTYSVQCNLNNTNIKNVNAILFSYLDESGNEIVNDHAIDWLNATNFVSVVD